MQADAALRLSASDWEGFVACCQDFLRAGMQLSTEPEEDSDEGL